MIGLNYFYPFECIEQLFYKLNFAFEMALAWRFSNSIWLGASNLIEQRKFDAISSHSWKQNNTENITK